MTNSSSISCRNCCSLVLTSSNLINCFLHGLCYKGCATCFKARLETALAKEVTLRTSNQSCMISMLQLPWSSGWIQQRDRVRQRSSWKNCQRQTTHVRKTFPSHFCKQGKIDCYIAFNQKKLIHGIPFCFSPRATDFNFCIRLRSIPSWLRAGWQMLSQIISVAACHCSVLLVTGHLLLAGIKMDCEVCN